MFVVTKAIIEFASRNRMAPALISAANYITYAELLEAVARISNHLADRNIPRGSKIFLNLKGNDLFVTAALACLHYGVTPFLLRNIHEEMDHDLVIGAPDMLAEPDATPDIEINSAILEGKNADARIREFPDRNDDECLFVAPTSGTTGHSKLVVETVGTFNAKMGFSGRTHPDDRVMSSIGFTSMFGFGHALRLLVSGGAIARPAASVVETLRLINMFGVTSILTTPSVLEQLVDGMERLGVRCPSVTRIQVTGGFLYRQLVERAELGFEAKLLVAYGSSEVGLISIGNVTSDNFEMGYVGDLIPDLTAVTMTSEEAPGPITILRNAATFCNYYRKGRIIREAEKYYTLPDIGYFDGRRVILLGREDEVFNASGNKIAFSVIEAALRDLPGVSEVGMINGSAVDEPLSLIVAIVAEPEFDLELAADRVRRVLRATPATTPLRLFRASSIRRNALGKVDRKALMDAYRSANLNPASTSE